jgi:cytochrome c-type biogenesis protein CcmF
MEAKGVFSTVSRESALVANNILLAVACFVVFIGTMWPLIAELLFDRKLSVGAPFFNAAFTPFMVALAIILPLGALLPWKRAEVGRAMQPLWGLLVLAIAAGSLLWTIQTSRSILAPMGMILVVWLVGGAIVDVWMRTGRGDLKSKARRFWNLPRADWGKSVAHAGFGITIFGIAALTAWQQEDIRIAQVGETFPVGVYEVTLKDVARYQGPNYNATRAEMEVTRNGRVVATLFPEKRNYPVARMPTTEAAIDNGFTRDLYLVIGDPQANGGWAVRTYIKPFANWIWAGCIIMAFGGMLSLTDRRFRVAAGARKRAAATPAVPAE